jgi:hypothetical protein
MNFLIQHIAADTNIFFGGDKHGGNLASHHDGFCEMRETILHSYDGVPAQHNKYVDSGDIIEAITLDDPRFDPESCDDYSPITQVNDAIKDYKPMAKHIICMLDGNHPRKLQRIVPYLTKHVCNLLDVPYGDYSAKITMRDMHDNYLFKIFGTHGRKSINSGLPDPAQRWSSMQRSLKNAMRRLADDCMVMFMGHSHQLIDVPPHEELYLYSSGGKLKQGYLQADYAANYISPDLRYYINTGSFFRTQMEGFSTYAEQAQYAPAVLGYYILKIRDFKIAGLERKLV